MSSEQVDIYFFYNNHLIRVNYGKIWESQGGCNIGLDQDLFKYREGIVKASLFYYQQINCSSTFTNVVPTLNLCMFIDVVSTLK